MQGVSQAILALDLPYIPTLEDFEIGLNGVVLATARSWCDVAANPHQHVLVWGGQGTGKSLLSQALAHSANAVLLTPQSNHTVFESAFQSTHVVVDDIHAFTEPQATWVFDLFNHLRTQAVGRWWATSQVPPTMMQGLRPDLSSRMSWGLVFELLPLDDASCVNVLQHQAARLGFDLNPETALYLLLRLERNLSVLAQHLSSLNQFALSLKKPVNNYLVQLWYKQIYLNTQ